MDNTGIKTKNICSCYKIVVNEAFHSSSGESPRFQYGYPAGCPTGACWANTERRIT